MISGARRQWCRLGIDLALVAVSAYAALIIRDNFVPSAPRLQAIVPYSLLCILSATIVFNASRLNRALWRYVSLKDILKLIAAVTIALLLALLGAFTLNRLEGVPRSLPVIQWFLLAAAMGGARIAARLVGEWRGRRARPDLHVQNPIEHILVIGRGDVAELYLRSVAEFAPSNLVIEGILSPGDELRGRSMRSHKILGKPEDVGHIVAQLEVHGVTVDRVVVTQPYEQLSRRAQEEIEKLERSSTTVDWIVESLRLRGRKLPDVRQASAEATVELPTSTHRDERGPSNEYHRAKRIIDTIAAVCLSVLVAPLLLLVALLVALDVGFPLVFWQKRPGRYGRPFRLYKFRTMGEAHDAEGIRLPDELRSSSVGRFLRRSRLDELPQLFNILVGDMSFVGPRPLLSSDQPKEQALRLHVRPGLTGWAQVNGGRDISSDEKAVLDAWYVENASAWLEVKILFGTVRMLLFGERQKRSASQAATTRRVETGP